MDNTRGNCESLSQETTHKLHERHFASYDAAPMAVLIIKENGNTYMTNGFDHGNPPKPIHLIVNKVLSIKESMVKQ